MHFILCSSLSMKIKFTSMDFDDVSLVSNFIKIIFFSFDILQFCMIFLECSKPLCTEKQCLNEHHKIPPGRTAYINVKTLGISP